MDEATEARLRREFEEMRASVAASRRVLKQSLAKLADVDHYLYRCQQGLREPEPMGTMTGGDPAIYGPFADSDDRRLDEPVKTQP